MESSSRQLALGIVAVVVAAALCVFALWSVRGRLAAPRIAASAVPAGVAAPVPTAADLAAQNVALREQIARLRRERDAALARLRAFQAAPTAEPAPPVQAKVAPRPAPAGTGAFGEPQTFESLSTAH
ncbi:MAG TPA: hypothetical protein VMH02_07035 [Verrucomicrobiae bacterium]|nr:hypothetical protein [Verrucomicrobiae bacterium]